MSIDRLCFWLMGVPTAAAIIIVVAYGLALRDLDAPVCVESGRCYVWRCVEWGTETVTRPRLICYGRVCAPSRYDDVFNRTVCAKHGYVRSLEAEVKR